MIPFKKLASLFVRTFSKPVSNFIKRYALNTTNKRSVGRRIVRNTFIYLGNKYNAFDVYIERSALGQLDIYIKPLTDEAAFLKGTDLFADLFVYVCVLGIPLFEMIRQSEEANKKQAIQDLKLNVIANEVETLQKIEDKIKEIQNKIEILDQEIITKIKTTTEQLQIQLQ